VGSVLDERLAAERYCYLTTTGRRTGHPRTVEIWFGLRGGTIYILAGDRAKANWVKNAAKTPDVTIKIRDNAFAARARSIADQTEDALARQLLYEKYAGDEWAETPQSLMDWAQTALPLAFDLS
jgi:deazaflavin-dependent oxidoreductase (nitroreductase family)